jgi:hypothetical protein
MYKVRHFGNWAAGHHEENVQKGLDEIGEAEIYSVQHAITGQGSANMYFSTIIIYRVYEDR